MRLLYARRVGLLMETALKDAKGAGRVIAIGLLQQQPACPACLPACLP